MARDSATFVQQLPTTGMRWLLPSAADLLFTTIFVLLTFTALSIRLLGDAGIGWHIRTGQLILSTHSIPRTDPFSSTMSGSRWFAWEWLYDAIVGWLDSISGLNGVIVLTALVISLTFSLAFRMVVRRGTNLLYALVLVLLAASGSMIHFFTRPHVFTWFFTLLWFLILDSAERDSVVSQAGVNPHRFRNFSALWMLPLTMLLWVNLHGGFLIGFVLLGFYWISALQQASRRAKGGFAEVLLRIRAARRLRDLTLIGALSLIATLLNPYGPRLYVHIFRYLSNQFLMDHIDEFQSPNFHLVAQKCFAVLLLLTIIALVVRRKSSTKLRLSQILLLLFAVYAGLYSSRNIPISSILLIVMIGPWLSQGPDSSSQLPLLCLRTSKITAFLHRMRRVELNLTAHLWPLAVLFFACFTASKGGRLNSARLMDAHFDAKRFPVAALGYLEQQKSQGPIFAPDVWGGYIIYRLYPETKVVVDDRHDLYGESFLRSYLQAIHVEPNWRQFFEQHPANYLLLPKNSALANILAETREWRCVYHDDVAVIFVPSNQ